MRRRVGRILIACGIVLIVVAACFVGRYLWEGAQASRAADVALSQVKGDISGSHMGTMDLTRNMTEVEIDGRTYIGYLSVPSVNLEVPVQSIWSYDALSVSPARFSGSAFSSDLVLCGHSYTQQFAKLYGVELGALVTFTTMDGDVFSYTVSSLDTLDPTAVDAMTTATTDWDLTLFTCTTSGALRWTVRCSRDSVAWAN